MEEGGAMDKKIIQEERMRSYFIEAAKRIVREEGVKSLTVKKIANLAGYAPGTLYNYFSDLNTLLFYCVADFLEESKKEIQNKVGDIHDEKEKLITATRAYSEYFINNPNVFELVFMEDLGPVPENLKEEILNPKIVLILNQILMECAQKGIISKERTTLLENIIGSSINGLLLFVIKNKTRVAKEEIIKLIEEEVNYLLGAGLVGSNT